ncbi:MAG: iron-containing alcohol dehydrogenase [Chloroflexi bacterium]|nr:iron-containing alcohol dehydrogenase [Chloroflexota bacterium]
MRSITLLQPGRIVFGQGCAAQCAQDLLARGARRVFLVSSPPLTALYAPLAEALRAGGAEVYVHAEIDREPTVRMAEEAVAAARAFVPDAVVGLGGGSALDVAKVVAALHDGSQTPGEILGIGLLSGRRTYLTCLPTTAGTGSEVSPNAILLDEAASLKKGAVSPFLVPDAAYVDPLLTVSMPPPLTAATGMDAMCHCVESYLNLNPHPIVDLYVLEGIRLIGANLRRAVADGKDIEAREKMALGSLYGGLALGPVNTNGVHALSYPLGSAFHVAHGISNAVLLPYVLEFNLPAMPQRYAEVARALGAPEGATVEETARNGIETLKRLSADVGIPERMSALGVPRDALPGMAEAAYTVQRLLRNNPRPMTVADIFQVYEKAY